MLLLLTGSDTGSTRTGLYSDSGCRQWYEFEGQFCFGFALSSSENEREINSKKNNRENLSPDACKYIRETLYLHTQK